MTANGNGSSGYRRLVASVLTVVSGVGLAVIAWVSFGNDHAWDTEDRVIVGATFALFAAMVRFLLGVSVFPDLRVWLKRWLGNGNGNGKDGDEGR